VPRFCDHARLVELARTQRVGAIIRDDKALFPVVNRLNLSASAARTVILDTIASLADGEFHGPGDGAPPPPCDVYFAEREHPMVEAGTVRFERVRWYVKVGIHVTGHLFVESFHP
jgi:hypothetical protein